MYPLRGEIVVSLLFPVYNEINGCYSDGKICV